MALIVEDGSIVAGAASYASVADADAYFAGRGDDLWVTMITTEKEQALVRGSDYMTQTYRMRLKGVRVSTAQPLDWPRYYVQLTDVGFAGQPVYVAANIVPQEIKNACCELALLAAAGPLRGSLKQNVINKKVGPIDVMYDVYSPQAVRYPQIDVMIPIYLKRGSQNNVMSLTRT
jgi:hypothetical protein